MIQYEALNTLSLMDKQTKVRSRQVPNIVHLNDPASSVLFDFRLTPPRLIDQNESMDHALTEMKNRGIHILLVTDDNDHVVGVITTEDLLGEKPIQIMQENRFERSKIQVHMLMDPIADFIAVDSDRVQTAKVGNIINTLKSLSQHYALVVQQDEGTEVLTIVGLFSSSHICRQLYADVVGSNTN